MLSTPEEFAEVAGRQLGTRQNDNIVVYDTVGLFRAGGWNGIDLQVRCFDDVGLLSEVLGIR